VNGDAHHSQVIVIRIAFVVDRKRALLSNGAILEEPVLGVRIMWHNAVHEGQGMDSLDLFLYVSMDILFI